MRVDRAYFQAVEVATQAVEVATPAVKCHAQYHQEDQQQGQLDCAKATFPEAVVALVSCQ
jgi:hypothetical protein